MKKTHFHGNFENCKVFTLIDQENRPPGSTISQQQGQTLPLVPQFHNNRDRPYSNPKLQRSFNLYSRGAGAAMSPSEHQLYNNRDRPYSNSKLQRGFTSVTRAMEPRGQFSLPLPSPLLGFQGRSPQAKGWRKTRQSGANDKVLFGICIATRG